MHRTSRSRAAQSTAQNGIALITSLLMLVVMTLLALSMFRSVGLQEKIAGNTREKQRSFDGAQSALQYGEWWLSQPNNAGTGTTCSTVYNANNVASMMICTNPLVSPTTLPWSARGDYLPPNMTVLSGGGVTTTGVNAGDINYFAKPSVYITFLGTMNAASTNPSRVYLVTGSGYGGSANGASVVQSTFAIAASKVTDLGQQ